MNRRDWRDMMFSSPNKRDWCNIPIRVTWHSTGQWRDLRIWLIDNVNELDYEVCGVDLDDYNKRIIYFAREKDALWFSLKWC